jgi:hypothetical protein
MATIEISISGKRRRIQSATQLVCVNAKALPRVPIFNDVLMELSPSIFHGS